MSNPNYATPEAVWKGTVDTTYASTVSGRITTTSFSGADMLVHFMFPGLRPIAVGTASNLTYSIYRDKKQVRTLGRTSPKGVTKGPMTVAGTIVFTVINQHIVNDIRNILYGYDASNPISAVQRLRFDELPPFDIILTFANEYGQSAKMVIYGVTSTDEAMVFSTGDLFTENTITYMARDIDTMRGPVTPDMRMYTAMGESTDNNSEMLPRYNFSPGNLWSNFYKPPTPSPGQYGSAYKPTGSYTPPVDKPSAVSGLLEVTVLSSITNKAVPGVQVSAVVGGKSNLKTADSHGDCTFNQIAIPPSGSIAVRVGINSPGYTLIDGGGNVNVSNSAARHIILHVSPVSAWSGGSSPSSGPVYVPAAKPVTNDMLAAGLAAVVLQSAAVKWISDKLTEMGVNGLDLVKEVFAEDVMAPVISAISSGKSGFEKAVDAVKAASNGLYDAFKNALSNVSFSGILVTIAVAALVAATIWAVGALAAGGLTVAGMLEAAGISIEGLDLSVFGAAAGA